MRMGLATLAFCGLFLGGEAEAAPCSSHAISGLFEGTAKSSDGTLVEITLNLFCDKDSYRGQFFTSSGDFDAMDPAVKDGHFTAKFDTQAALGTVDLTPAGKTLSGAFELAGDKGTMSLTRIGDALAADAMTPRINLTVAEWQGDLRAFASELPKHHANAFFYLPKTEFKAEIAELSQKIPQLNDDERLMGLEKIVNAIGDGHTGIVYPQPRYPLGIEITKFGDEFRITATVVESKKTLGTRILKIGDTPIADAYAKVLHYTPSGELMELREGRALIYLTRGLILHGIDLIQDPTKATFTLQDDSGNVFSFELHAAPGAVQPMTSGDRPKLLAEQRPDATFWCDDIAKNAAVFCAFHSYQDLDKRAAEMFALIDKTHPEKLIIDMRDNGGGDNTVGYAQLILPLKARADLNRKGQLYVLIGPLTFSAAMNNAAQFQDETHAILVGRTIGEKPNSYQEPRQFRLPNSHLIVRASTLYYEFRKKGENAVRPNKEIIPTWDDVKSGRDPVLDWVLAQPVN